MPTLRARVDQEFKDRLDRLCEQAGRKEGELIRLALGRLLDKASESEEATAPSKEYEKAEQHINVYVTASEKRAISDRAKAEGMRPSRWLVWLARRYLTNQPHFNPAELDALREATRQLAAVGSNLNQVAHTLNIHMNQKDRVTDEMIKRVEADVKSVRQEIKRYVEVSLNRWGI